MLNLRPWEVEALDAMERVRLLHLNREGQEEEHQVEDRPLTPELFGALFG